MIFFKGAVLSEVVKCNNAVNEVISSAYLSWSVCFGCVDGHSSNVSVQGIFQVTVLEALDGC